MFDAVYGSGLRKELKKIKETRPESLQLERGGLFPWVANVYHLWSLLLWICFFFPLSFFLLFAFIYKRLSVVWSLTLSSTVATNNIPGSLSPSSFVAGIKVMASVSVCTCESSGFGRLVTFSVGQEGGTELFLPNMATRIWDGVCTRENVPLQQTQELQLREFTRIQLCPPFSVSRGP